MPTPSTVYRPFAKEWHVLDRPSHHPPSPGVKRPRLSGHRRATLFGADGTMGPRFASRLVNRPCQDESGMCAGQDDVRSSHGTVPRGRERNGSDRLTVPYLWVTICAG